MPTLTDEEVGLGGLTDTDVGLVQPESKIAKPAELPPTMAGFAPTKAGEAVPGEWMRGTSLMPVEEPAPKTSVLGTLAREAGLGVVPAIGGALGMGAGGYVGGIPGAFGGGLVGTEMAAEAQEDIIATVGGEQAVEDLERLRAASAKQHPVATAVGGVVSALPAFQFAPWQAGRRLWSLYKAIRGTATPVERQIARQTAGVAGLGAGYGVVSPLLHGQAPTIGGVLESAAFPLALGKPRFKFLEQPTRDLTTPYQRQTLREVARQQQQQRVGPLTPQEQVVEQARLAEEIGETTDASKVSQAAAVHGDVRTQPVEGAGAVPVQEGGAGVRAQAEAGVPQARRQRLLLKVQQGEPLTTDEVREVDDINAMAGRGEPLSDLQGQILDATRLASRTSTTEGIRYQRRAAPAEVTDTQYEQMEREGMTLSTQEQTTHQKTASLVSDASGKKIYFLKPRAEAEGGAADPFFAGEIARPSPTGKGILINVDAFNRWIARAKTPQQARQMIEGLVGEESIHGDVRRSIGDTGAADYYRGMTAFEKSIAWRRYSGRWRGRGTLTDSQLGHESIRFRLQRAANMTPREFAETVGFERWQIKGLTKLEDLVRGTREALGTNASRAQLDLLDKIETNLAAGRAAITGRAPMARERAGEEFETPEGVVKMPLAPSEKMRAEHMTPEEIQAAFPPAGKPQAVPVPEMTPEQKARLLGKVRYALAEGILGERPVPKLMSMAEASAGQPKPRLARANPPSPVTNEFGDPMGSSYHATPEDWSAWQDIRSKMRDALKAGQHAEFARIQRFAENIKNKYGGMPPEPPVEGTAPAARVREGEEPIEHTLQPGQKTIGDVRMGDTISDERGRWTVVGFLPDVGDRGRRIISTQNQETGARRTFIFRPETAAPMARERERPVQLGLFGRDVQKALGLPQTGREFELTGEATPELPAIAHPSAEEMGAMPRMTATQMEAFTGRWLDRVVGSMARAFAIRKGEAPKELTVSATGIRRVLDPTQKRAIVGLPGEEKQRYIRKQVVPAGAVVPKKAYVPKAPSFDRFAKQVARMYPGTSRSDLFDMWSRGIADFLAKATPEQLDVLRRTMKLESSFGDRPIPTAVVVGKPAELPPMRPLKGETPAEFAVRLRARAGEQARATREKGAAERKAMAYRGKLISAISDRLLKKSQEEYRLGEVTKVYPEDVDYGREAPGWTDFTEGGEWDPGEVGAAMREDTGRVSPETKVSTTRRMLVLQHPTKGTVYAVDAYLDPRKGWMVNDPTLPMHSTLESALKRWRARSTFLSKEPVENFTQKFENPEEFENEFATEAREIEERALTGEPQGEYEYGAMRRALISEKGDWLVGPGADIARLTAGMGKGAIQRATSELMTETDAGVLYDYVVRKSGTTYNPRIAVKSLHDKVVAGKKLTAQEWQAVAALQKIYDIIWRGWPKLTEAEAQAYGQTLEQARAQEAEAAAEQVYDEVHKHAQDAPNRASFSRIIYDRYGPGTPVPVRRPAPPPTGARELEVGPTTGVPRVAGRPVARGPGIEAAPPVTGRLGGEALLHLRPAIERQFPRPARALPGTMGVPRERFQTLTGEEAPPPPGVTRSKELLRELREKRGGFIQPEARMKAILERQREIRSAMEARKGKPLSPKEVLQAADQAEREYRQYLRTRAEEQGRARVGVHGLGEAPMALRRKEPNAMAILDAWYRTSNRGRMTLDAAIKWDDDLLSDVRDWSHDRLWRALQEDPKNPARVLDEMAYGLGYPPEVFAAGIRVTRALNRFQPTEKQRTQIEDWINDRLARLPDWAGGRTFVEPEPEPESLEGRPYYPEGPEQMRLPMALEREQADLTAKLDKSLPDWRQRIRENWASQPSEIRDLFKQWRALEQRQSTEDLSLEGQTLSEAGFEKLRRQMKREAREFQPIPRKARPTMAPGGADLLKYARGRPRLDSPMAMTRYIKDEYDRIGAMLSDLSKRGEIVHGISASLDATDNVTNNLADQAAFAVRVKSAGPKFSQRGGNPMVLAAAKALVQADAIRPDYTVDNGKRGAIRIFKAMVQRGMADAQAAIAGPSWRDRRRGRAWLRGANLLMRELDYAENHWMDPELQATAVQAKMELDGQYERERGYGFDYRSKGAYLPGRYDAELFNNDLVLFPANRVLGQKYRAPSTFGSYYEAIMNGPYIPATFDIASLVGHRVRQGTRQITKDIWRRGLHGITDPETGKPLVLRTLRTAAGEQSPDPNYIVVDMGGGHRKLAVLSGYEGIVRRLVGPDVIADWPATRWALELSQRIKHTLLIGDFFHLFRMLYYGTAIMRGKLGWRGGWSSLAMREADMDEAVRRGIITQRAADWSRERIDVTPPGATEPVTANRRQILEMFQTAGLNVGRVQDALYKDLIERVSTVAGLPKQAWKAVAHATFGRYNRFLFDKLTRGLMANSAVHEFERLHKARPDIPPDKLIRDIARDVNVVFGNLGRQGWLKAKWEQDLARMFFLAPQWVEGLIRKEATLASRATQVSRLLGRTGKEVPYMGTTGRSMGQGMLFMFGLTQLLNFITRGKATWQNEEKGHKWDAWIPGWDGGEGFWLSPLAIYNEITHDLVRLTYSREKISDALSQIAGNKASPYVRAIEAFRTARSPTGRYLTSSGAVAREMAKQVFPIPLTFSKTGQAIGHRLAPRLISAPGRGAVQRQAFATAGIKIEPAESAAQETSNRAAEWLRKEGIVPTSKFVPTDEPSYGQLRQSLRLGDTTTATDLLTKLINRVGEGQVIAAMRQWAKRPFTGSLEREQAFVDSLTPSARDVYARGMEEKQALEEQFEELLMQMPIIEASRQPPPALP